MGMRTSSVDSICFHWSSGVVASSFVPVEDAIAAILSFAWADRRTARARSGLERMPGALVTERTENIDVVNIVVCDPDVQGSSSVSREGSTLF